MRLVEAVTRELLHQVENLVALVRGQTVLGRTIEEDHAVLGHFLGLFLAHRPAQQVGAAKGITADDLRHLHDLLLIDHDAVGLGQNRFNPRVRINNPLTPVLAFDEIRNQVHRARAEQCDEGDDVFKAVGPRALHQITHATRFELENRCGVAVDEDPVSVGVIQRNLFQRERRVGIQSTDKAQRPVENRQRGQSEKIELHQPDLLDVVLIELRNRVFRTGGAVQGTEIAEFAGRYQHPACVHPDVTRQALQLFGERQQFARFFIRIFPLLEPRFHFARHLQRNEFAGLERDEFRQFVGAPVTPLHHAAYVAHHRFGSHGSESGYLGDRFTAVFLAHVFDHPVAPVLTKVDIEVGHRNAFRVEEAFEQQVVLQGIEVRDAQRVGHQGTGTGSSSGADRHTVVFRPVDEVGNNQEITGKTHLNDGFDFECQPFPVPRQGFFALVRIRIEVQQPLVEPLCRLLREILFQGHVTRRRKLRQLRFAQIQYQAAAARDLDRVLQRLRQVGEQLRHFRLCLEVLVFGIGPGPALVREHIALRNTHARFVREKLLARKKLDRVRGDDRQAECRCQRHGLAQQILAIGLSGPLQFEVIAPGKQL